MRAQELKLNSYQPVVFPLWFLLLSALKDLFACGHLFARLIPLVVIRNPPKGRYNRYFS